MEAVSFVQKIQFFISFLILACAQQLNSLDQQTTLISSVIFIFLLGVPHGAIDHLLLKTGNSKLFKGKLFYIFYFASMLGIMALWYLLPVISLILFILISAYHFGESELYFLEEKKSTWFSIIIIILWGISILSAYLFHNYEATMALISSAEMLKEVPTIFSVKIAKYLFIVSTASMLLCYISLSLNKQFNKRLILKELVIFVIIHLIFFLLNPLIAFTSYFVVWHSLRVLSDELTYLKSETEDSYNIINFVKQLLPYTVMSVIGGALFIFLYSKFELNVSPFLLTVIFLSVLTFPHSIVMTVWYKSAVAKPRPLASK